MDKCEVVRKISFDGNKVKVERKKNLFDTLREHYICEIIFIRKLREEEKNKIGSVKMAVNYVNSVECANQIV